MSQNYLLCKPHIIGRILSLHNQGMSLRAIARKENLSPNTAKKYLLLNGKEVKCKNVVYRVRNSSKLLIGLYTGIWAGDGTQFIDGGFRIKICCDSRNNELIAFIQNLLLKLFGKKSSVVREERNRALIRFNSKFIYHFVHNFIKHGRNKTHTVHLKSPLKEYSDSFLEGFLLGLMLSDGYLKEKFYFNNTSKKLANNVRSIFRKFGLRPKIFVNNRERYGWKNLYSVYLTKSESAKALNFLNRILSKIGYKEDFLILKGYIQSPL